MTRASELSGLRPHAEMLRRKGRSIADAQRMPDKPDPRYMVLTWNAKEEASFEKWLEAYAPGREWGGWLLCWDSIAAIAVSARGTGTTRPARPTCREPAGFPFGRRWSRSPRTSGRGVPKSAQTGESAAAARTQGGRQSERG
ncbi:MAG: hypothetical protein ACR2NO_01370 [Chloroflexota bacterium]